MRFQCLKCGFCCRNLVVDFGEWTLGLLLLPDEVNLFPQEKIAPMWGIGVKGRSRPRPEKVGVFQFNTKICVHLTEQNTCRIYAERPLICHAHPLNIQVAQGRLISASVNGSCKGVGKIPINSRIKLSDYFDDDVLEANTILSTYLERMFVESHGYVWLYDLASCKWKRVTQDSYPESEVESVEK
jgi:Fe-S-cluster containining protein